MKTNEKNSIALIGSDILQEFEMIQLKGGNAPISDGSVLPSGDGCEIGDGCTTGSQCSAGKGCQVGNNCC